MKESTKELIEWIKESLPTGFPNYRQEAIYFLDDLPKIESYLCRGGYIQDKNGTPCCEGDKVKFQGSIGTLRWDNKSVRFYVVFKVTNTYVDYTVESFQRFVFFTDEIEKVE